MGLYHRFDGYDELWRWSITDLDAFWRSIWDHFDLRSATPVGEALADDRMPGARWFPGIELNYASHALRAAGRRGPALVGLSQSRARVEVSGDELRDQVARCRAGLARLGVRRGDRVAAYLPNIPETVVALLAVASLGAVWSSCAPEFGIRSVVDRLRQIEPSVLLAVDGYRYGAKAVDRRAEGAALQLAARMGLEPALLVHAKAMGLDFTFFVVYGSVTHLVDLREVTASPGGRMITRTEL